MIESVVEMFTNPGKELWWTLGVSGGLLLLSLLSLPVVALLLPQDFLVRPTNKLGHAVKADPRHPVLRWTLIVLKNLAGVALAIAGIAMLVLPGQGVLTLMFALLLLDIPGKQKLERKFLGSKRVLKMLNGLRQRMGRPPLDAPKIATTTTRDQEA